MPDPDGPEAARRTARARRGWEVVVGVVLTLVAGVLLVAAPDVTTALERDLPFLAGSLLALFSGGILLGLGYGRRAASRRGSS